MMLSVRAPIRNLNRRLRCRVERNSTSFGGLCLGEIWSTHTLVEVKGGYSSSHSSLSPGSCPPSKLQCMASVVDIETHSLTLIYQHRLTSCHGSPEGSS